MGSDESKKSCFNCTKRRIVCDLTPPKCQKCKKKGLECPGYGIRYRFTDGKTVSTFEMEASVASEAAGATSTRRGNSLKWVNSSVRARNRRGLRTRETISGPRQSSNSTGARGGPENNKEARDQTSAHISKTDGFDVQPLSSRPATSALHTEIDVAEFSPPTSVEESEVDIEVTRDDPLKDPMNTKYPTSISKLPPLLSSPDPKIRLLLNHFSAYVSPIMVMYDDGANGYRHQILPLAHSDPVVERAICVAAAFHLSRTMPELRLPAESGRAAIINKLSMSMDLSDTTWTTIILLIVADLVTGHEQVITLYKMLVSFLDARGQAIGQQRLGGGSPLGEFLYYQSRVISFFAYPILGESRALSDISRILKESLGSIEQYTPPSRRLPLEFLVTTNEIQASSLTRIDSRTQLYIDIIREATEIYLLRMNTSGNNSTLPAVSQAHDPLDSSALGPALRVVAPQLATIRCLFEQVDPSAPGSHTIVWPAFVAAAESQSDNDRIFFTAVLQRIWDSTGYANVLKGSDALLDIWEQQKHGRSWTSILPELKTIVM